MLMSCVAVVMSGPLSWGQIVNISSEYTMEGVVIVLIRITLLNIKI